MANQKYGDKDFYLSVKSYYNIYDVTPRIVIQTNDQNHHHLRFHPEELNHMKYRIFRITR